LRELVKGMQRLEAKLDRLITAAAAPAGAQDAERQPGPVKDKYQSVDSSAGPGSGNGMKSGSGGEGSFLQVLQRNSGPDANVPRHMGSFRQLQRHHSSFHLAGSGLTLPDWEPADKMEVLDLKLDFMDKKLERIAGAVGVRTGGGPNEEEDRRRLKEKLKEALESAQRNRQQQVESEKEVWMEYLFGICKPDGRIGKTGSRRVQFASLVKAKMSGVSYCLDRWVFL
jgi:hypothetical protein